MLVLLGIIVVLCVFIAVIHYETHTKKREPYGSGARLVARGLGWSPPSEPSVPEKSEDIHT